MEASSNRPHFQHGSGSEKISDFSSSQRRVFMFARFVSRFVMLGKMVSHGYVKLSIAAQAAWLGDADQCSVFGEAKNGELFYDLKRAFCEN